MNLRDEFPDLITPLHVLKTECEIRAIRLCPYNERILLALIYIRHAHNAIEEDLLRVLGACDESCFFSVLVKVALTERGTAVRPSRANKFVHL